MCLAFAAKLAGESHTARTPQSVYAGGDQWSIVERMDQSLVLIHEPSQFKRVANDEEIRKLQSAFAEEKIRLKALAKEPTGSPQRSEMPAVVEKMKAVEKRLRELREENAGLQPAEYALSRDVHELEVRLAVA